MLNAALLLSILGVVAAWGQGHTIAGNKVVVDRQAHWQQWTFPAGTLDIDETGAVRPHFVSKNILATVRHRGVYQARQGLGGTRPCATPSTRALGPQIWSTFSTET